MKLALVKSFGLVSLLLLGNLLVAAQGSDSLSAAANKYYQSKDWDNATTSYQQLAAKEPNNASYWFRLGVALQATQKFTEAIAAYEKAENISHAPNVMYNLACAYARAANKDKALAWLDKVANTNFPALKNLQSDEDLASVKSDPRFAEVMKKMERAAKPCAFSPSARQFDFWLGEWDVKGLNGQQVGTNSVQLMLGDCVIYENWTDGYGNSGKSINVFHPQKNKWQQTWVDDKGNVAEFVNGEFKDGAMRFTNESKDKAGKTVLGKLTFYFLEADKVRQHAEQSADDGKSWTTQYDLTYYRKKQIGQNKQE